MNDRIRELVRQATTYIEPTADSGEGWIFDKEKFAELIVGQMLDITDAHTEVFQTDRDKAVIEHIKQSVKTHFGVEE